MKRLEYQSLSIKDINCTILLLGVAITRKTSIAKCWKFPDANNTKST